MGDGRRANVLRALVWFIVVFVLMIINAQHAC